MVCQKVECARRIRLPKLIVHARPIKILGLAPVPISIKQDILTLVDEGRNVTGARAALGSSPKRVVLVSQTWACRRSNPNETILIVPRISGRHAALNLRDQIPIVIVAVGCSTRTRQSVGSLIVIA